ncbi:hypothetical protein OSB04_027617 [Centaurea solstitialis]|uniref:PI4-kinase N-terminal domain-containing protein n=1 Tax=Centaurea solstitialis TaxID=347529 RepID=A0AA38SSH1_9ASTR|nr:hypothetical protein OSB04_027617 [Centaurea solstitialis]
MSWLLWKGCSIRKVMPSPWFTKGLKETPGVFKLRAVLEPENGVFQFSSFSPSLNFRRNHQHYRPSSLIFSYCVSTASNGSKEETQLPSLIEQPGSFSSWHQECDQLCLVEECEDVTIRLFLRETCFLFLKYLKSRKTFIPNGSNSASEVQNEIVQNKMFMQGSDKNRHPIAVVFGGRHYYCNKKGGLEEFKRFVVFGLDKLCSKISRGQEKFVVIGDLQGWGYLCTDIRGYLAALAILQFLLKYHAVWGSMENNAVAREKRKQLLLMLCQHEAKKA